MEERDTERSEDTHIKRSIMWNMVKKASSDSFSVRYFKAFSEVTLWWLLEPNKGYHSLKADKDLLCEPSYIKSGFAEYVMSDNETRL